MLAKLKKRPYIFFLIPGLIVYTALVVYPIISAMQLSLFRWNGIGEKVFVGFNNYKALFTDDYLMKQFANALINSIKLFLLTTLIQTPLQIIMA
ncbi:MAG: sugar ABC transporter permease, partial [Eubacteriales bacterium]|nr:sugar ABC transporter permease [Eubacteriales bacterium]